MNKWSGLVFPFLVSTHPRYRTSTLHRLGCDRLSSRDKTTQFTFRVMRRNFPRSHRRISHRSFDDAIFLCRPSAILQTRRLSSLTDVGNLIKSSVAQVASSVPPERRFQMGPDLPRHAGG